MGPNLEQILPEIVRNKRLHARWINTFSFLEFLGFRKIVKSQSVSSVDDELLTHAVEEGRHALRLKRFAMDVGGADFKRYAPELLLCADEARAYFDDLDDGVFAALQGEARARYWTYCYVTWLVEVRALSIYGLYQKELGGKSSPIAGILKEEEGHLDHVRRELEGQDPRFREHAAQFRALEEALYRNYLTALTKWFETRPTEKGLTIDA